MLSQLLASEHRMSAEKRVVLHSWHCCFSVELHGFLRSVSPTTVIQWRQLTCHPNDKQHKYTTGYMFYDQVKQDLASPILLIHSNLHPCRDSGYG